MGARFAVFIALALVLMLVGAAPRTGLAGLAGSAALQGDADCSGEVDAGDAVEDLRVGDGVESPDSCANEAGDVDCDGDLDGLDALTIVSRLADISLATPYWCLQVGEPLELPPTSEELIAAALAAGDIDYETSLLYRAYALYGDPRLPAEHQSDVLDYRAGRALFAEIDENEGTLSQELLDELAPWRVRPADPDSIFNQGDEVQTAGIPNPPPPTWYSRLVAGGKVRIWMKDFVSPEADFDYMEPIVTDIYEEVSGLLKEPIADTPGDAASNPDSAIDLYFPSFGETDPRYTCPADPANCWRKTTSVGLASVVNAAPRAISSAGASTSSAYGLLGDEADSPELIVDLAQVFTYASTFAYDWNEDEWLTDTTVDWGGYRALKGLGKDRSTFYRGAIREVLRNPLETLTRSVSTMGPHGGWLYFLFATQEAGDGIVRQVWEKAAAAGQQGRDAIDQAFPFQEHFDAFSLRNWNVKPPLLKDYHEKDTGFPSGTAQRNDVHMQGPETFRIANTHPPLSSSYTRFDFARSLRTVKVDVDTLPANARVWALVQIGGEWQEPEDWTGIGHKEYCRDDPSENLTALVLIVSNRSMTESADLTHGPLVDGDILGCNGWAGTVTSTWDWRSLEHPDWHGSATTTFTGRWNYEGVDVVSCADPINAPCISYYPTGTIDWTWDSHFGSCDETKSGTETESAFFGDFARLVLVPDLFAGNGENVAFKYWVATPWRTSDPGDCQSLNGSNQGPNPWDLSPEASSGNIPSPRGENCFTTDWVIVVIATEIKGSCVEANYNIPQNNDYHVTYTWDLHAVGNPTGP